MNMKNESNAFTHLRKANLIRHCSDGKGKTGFTLAETMIVIVVLGIIATLTIPALVNKNKESVAKTKVRKAMAAYESALNKMIIENDLKDNTPLITWAGNAGNNCANSTNYFKKIQGDGCIFKTSDGIWWNISNIERPLIAFNQDNLTIAKANDANDKTAFVLVGRFGTDGSLRVDDLAYETANSIEDAYGNESKAQVEKLYKLLGMKSSNAGGGNQSPFAACNGAETCTITYNCPTTDEPNKTCEMNYKKIIIEEDYSEIIEYYCDPNNWVLGNYEICGEDDDKWEETITSNSKTGEYYIAIEGYPSKYCTGPIYSNCTDWGDYYNAAKNHCETSGGRLANMAEMKSLISQGEFPSDSVFWFSEGNTIRDDSEVYYYDEVNYNDIQVLCIGNP